MDTRLDNLGYSYHSMCCSVVGKSWRMVQRIIDELQRVREEKVENKCFQ